LGLSCAGCAVDDPSSATASLWRVSSQTRPPRQVAFFPLPVRGALPLGLAHYLGCVMFLSVILSGLRLWRRSRETTRQLAALTDRELSDIGLSRGDIHQAARQGR
jgi:uncharacterized protein YjiS (DUF1127 family)